MRLLLPFSSCLIVVKALNCHHPFVPENGQVTFDMPAPYIPNTVAKYRHVKHNCAAGFDKIGGTDERICTSSGSWSGEAPICVIDVAAGKPRTQSSGNATVTMSHTLCSTTDDIQGSWWEVDLLGSFDVRDVAIRVGKHSSPIMNIYLIQKNGDLRLCDISHQSFLEDATVTVPCKQNDVTKVRVVSEFRLHLCTVKVFAINAVSMWQCSQSATMDVLGVFDGLCYSSSRDEKADWQRAQRKCLDRGATLPMKITETAKRGIRVALTTSALQNDYYWIGATSSLVNWRWADGSAVDEDEADWSTTTILPSSHPEAIVLARVVDWRWIPSSQNVWNSFLCQSKPKSCTFPGISEAGRVTFTSQNLVIGTYAIYSCDNGYELDGNAERLCEENALWSGKIPLCKKRKCKNVEEWSGGGNVYLINASTEFGSEVEYSCPNGWKLVGAERRRCQEDGRWSGSAPFCRVVDCGAPPSIPNGRVSTVMTTFGSKTNYSCHDGYRLIGHDVVTCGSKGIWEPAIPVCYDKIALRELKTDATDDDHTVGVTVLIIMFGLLLMLGIYRHSRTSASFAITDKSSTPFGAPGMIYVTPSKLMNPASDSSVVYYASSGVPFAKMEIPPHLLSLKQLPNGNIEATMPIGRPFIRPQLPTFAPSPTPSQLLYSFDYEPIYDLPPEVNRSQNCPEENIYERPPDVQPDTK